MLLVSSCPQPVHTGSSQRSVAAEPFVSLYFQSQWTPLVLFFLMYLYVIRNNKLHHFMRFYCMQVWLGLALSAICLQL